MTADLPTTLPGDMLRKAVKEYTEIRNKKPESTHAERINEVAIKFDLSPMQSDFLNRQLRTASEKI